MDLLSQSLSSHESYLLAKTNAILYKRSIFYLFFTVIIYSVPYRRSWQDISCQGPAVVTCGLASRTWRCSGYGHYRHQKGRRKREKGEERKRNCYEKRAQNSVQNAHEVICRQFLFQTALLLSLEIPFLQEKATIAR